MENCNICLKPASNGINLSDGSIIHESCLSKMQKEEIELKNKIESLNDKLTRFQEEIQDREKPISKLLSIFVSSKNETAEIENSIATIKASIYTTSKQLSPVQKYLESLYDRFLTYPPDWVKRKCEVINRDGYSCSTCGKYHLLHLHHITPLSKGGSNKISNLKLECEKCHKKTHGGRNFSIEYTGSETAFSKRVSDIHLAIQNGDKITFGYKKPNEKTFKKRVVKPHEIADIPHVRDGNSTLCVTGYCELRNAIRTFAVKRMRGLKITTETSVYSTGINYDACSNDRSKKTQLDSKKNPKSKTKQKRKTNELKVKKDDDKDSSNYLLIHDIENYLLMGYNIDEIKSMGYDKKLIKKVKDST